MTKIHSSNFICQ